MNQKDNERQEKILSGNLHPDDYFQNNVEEAKKDEEAMYDLYRNYVRTAESDEERLRRIQNFRCGGRR